MARKRGNLKVVFKVVDGVGYIRLVHTGVKGNRTLGRFSHDLKDRATFKETAAAWLATAHPRLRQPTEAS